MAQIVDYLGRPIKTGSLTKEIATTNLASVRTHLYDSVANELTPERLAQIIAAVDQNDTLEYLTLAEEMEERDLHYHSVLGTRKAAVAGLEVMVEATTDDDRDVEIAEFVRDQTTTDAFTGLVDDQLDALGKGYSVCEIMWDRTSPKWIPREYKWRDPRYFQFDIETGLELRLRDESDMLNGLALEPYKFIQHRPRIKTGLPIRGGLARLAVVAYMCKGYALKDWLAFAEVFGMPIRVGKYDTAATTEQKAALLQAVSQIGTDAACIIPDSMLIEFIDAAKTSGGDTLFLGLGDWLDRQTSKGVLGQVASTEGTPGRLGSDHAQEAVREDIKVSDAARLSATLRRDLVRPLVDLNYGVPADGKYPKARLVIEKPEDLESLAKSLPPFIGLGLKVEASVIRDKFKLPEPEKGAEILAPLGGGTTEARAQLALAAAQKAQEDEIDHLVEGELGDWKRVMDPVLQPVLAWAREAKDYKEFLGGLENVLAQMDSSELVKSLALSMFKARGVGDSDDTV